MLFTCHITLLPKLLNSHSSILLWPVTDISFLWPRDNASGLSHPSNIHRALLTSVGQSSDGMQEQNANLIARISRGNSSRVDD